MITKLIAFVLLILFPLIIKGDTYSQDGTPFLANRRLVKINEVDPPQWLSQEQINYLIANKVHFMDITNRILPMGERNVAETVKEYPTHIRFQNVVKEAIIRINLTRMAAFVKKFDNFPNRYYKSQSGMDSSNWLYSEVLESIVKYNESYNGTVKVDKFQHSWPQNSIICRITGSDTELKDEVIIFGAHLDSINHKNPNKGMAPGSDDNASGSVTLLESLKVLMDSEVVPSRTIEFHWYAAEEVGLRGSGDIAESYYNKGVKVVGMVNFDVVGYKAGENKIAFVNDRTDPALNKFLKKVVGEYCNYKWAEQTCGYGCSDHASFHMYKYPASCASEDPINPYMHTKDDTTGRMSFEQVSEFVKLTLGTAIELSEPVGS